MRWKSVGWTCTHRGVGSLCGKSGVKKMTWPEVLHRGTVSKVCLWGNGLFGALESKKCAQVSVYGVSDLIKIL